MQQHLQKNIQACNNQQKSIFEGAERQVSKELPPGVSINRGGEGVWSKQGDAWKEEQEEEEEQ